MLTGNKSPNSSFSDGETLESEDIGTGQPQVAQGVYAVSPSMQTPVDFSSSKASDKIQPDEIAMQESGADFALQHAMSAPRLLIIAGSPAADIIGRCNWSDCTAMADNRTDYRRQSDFVVDNQLENTRHADQRQIARA